MGIVEMKADVLVSFIQYAAAVSSDMFRAGLLSMLNCLSFYCGDMLPDSMPIIQGSNLSCSEGQVPSPLLLLVEMISVTVCIVLLYAIIITFQL